MTQKNILRVIQSGIYNYFTKNARFPTWNPMEGKVEALAAYGNWNNEIYYNLMKLARINEARIINRYG